VNKPYIAYFCSMRFIDTHAHLYLPEFDADRADVVALALTRGVDTILLPNIDSGSVMPMLAMCAEFPDHCKPMMGLHPTSVTADADKELQLVKDELARGIYVAVGEIGIDLYWSVEFQEEQVRVFREQLRLAKSYGLPVAIHTREAFPLILDVVEQEKTTELTGVFHCFSGSERDARRIMDLGFMMGIGGVITYKKSNLPEIVAGIPTEYLVLETDAPFLPPVPFRGKRNQSDYLLYIAHKLAEVKHLRLDEVAAQTTDNALRLFSKTEQH
jgi:TatD DNase family protein